MGCSDVFSALQDEFGTSIQEVRSYAPADTVVPTPKPPATPTPVPLSSGARISPIVLGGGADRASDLTPGAEPREGRRQVQHDAAHGAFHPYGELDQPLPQRGD